MPPSSKNREAGLLVKVVNGQTAATNERLKMIDVPAWTALAEKLHKVGLDIFATANVPITDKGFADEKVLALALLARTLSHLKRQWVTVKHTDIDCSACPATRTIDMSHGVPAVMAHRIVGDHSGDRSALQRSTMRRAAWRAASLAASAASSALRFRRRSATLGVLRPRGSSGIAVSIRPPPQWRKGYSHGSARQLENARNPLTRKGRFCTRLGKNLSHFNAGLETLNQRVLGSSPCAPTNTTD